MNSGSPADKEKYPAACLPARYAHRALLRPCAIVRYLVGFPSRLKVIVRMLAYKM